MPPLLLSCGVFLGIHVFTGSRWRDSLVAAIGAPAYRGLFSLVSIAVMAWIVVAYRNADLVPVLWTAPTWLRWPALVLAAIAVLLVVLGLSTPSPTTAGGESTLRGAEPARGVLRITRHPFLNGVALWAATHVALNGDAASLVLFGTMLVLAVLGPAQIDAKRRRAFGAAWQRFESVTSAWPFGAVADGRNQVRLDEIGAARFAIAAGVFALLLASHAWLFGVSPLP